MANIRPAKIFTVLIVQHMILEPDPLRRKSVAKSDAAKSDAKSGVPASQMASGGQLPSRFICQTFNSVVSPKAS